MSLYITLVLYFFIIFTIGFKAYRATKNHEDYVLGGRKLNAIVTALGVGASDMSGWLMIGLPGAIYFFGFEHLWMPVGLLLGAFLNWSFIAERLRIFTIEANNSLTIPSYLEHRFNDKSKMLRSITAIVVIIFFSIYTAAGFVSSAILFSSTFGIDYHSALILGVLLLVSYTTIGGFLAVNWVDVFQGGLMLLALIFLPSYIVSIINSSDPNLLSIVYLKANYSSQFSSDYFNMIPTGGFIAATISIISTTAWGLGYFGQPHILVRFMASDSKKSIKKAKKICMSWMLLALIGAISVGFFGKVFYLNSPLADPEHVFFALIQDNVNEWLAGWLVAAVLSCIMSTSAAQLILSSTAISEDVYHARINANATDKQLLWVGRVSIIFVAMIAIVLAWNKNSSVLELVGHAWAGLGASFGPVILCSLFWPRMTKNGAISGISVGAITVLGWVAVRYLWLNNMEAGVSILQVYEIVPAFITSIMSIFIVSINDINPDKKTAQLYNRAHALCKDSVV